MVFPATIRFSWLDYTLFCLMFSLSGVIGIYHGCFGNKQSTAKDYLYGGKNMRVIPVALSMVASTLSGISLLGIPGEVYQYGTQFWMVGVGAVLMAVINNFVYLPVFYNLQLNSVYEYLQMRFDKNVRKFASFLFSVCTFLYLPVVICAPALAFNQMTGFDVYLIAPIISLVCIFYTTIGGLKTVVWADTLQFTVTLCTMALVLVMGTISVGGVSAIWEKAQLGNRIELFNMDPDPTLRATFWSVTIGQTFIWISYISINPAGVQRFLATPSLTNAKRTIILFVIMTIITKSISCFSGLIMYAKYYDCDPQSTGQIKRFDQIFPYYVLDVAQHIPGLGGLFIAGIFSTALSTLSTYLNTLSGTIYTDFILPYLPDQPSEQRASYIIKIVTVSIGIASLLLSFVFEKLGSIIEMWMSLNGVTSGPLIGIFTLGMLFPFANAKGALWGGIGSLLFMSWVIIKAQMHMKSGAIRYQSKPLSTLGCNATSNLTFNLNETIITPTLLTVGCPKEEPFWLFKISLHYYAFLGTLVALILGLSISWATRKEEKLEFKSDLLSPFIHRFLSNSTKAIRYNSVDKEMHELNVEGNKKGALEPSLESFVN